MDSEPLDSTESLDSSLHDMERYELQSDDEESKHIISHSLVTNRQHVQQDVNESHPVNDEFVEPPVVVDRNVAPPNITIGGAFLERITSDSLSCICSFLAFDENRVTFSQCSKKLCELFTPTCYGVARSLKLEFRRYSHITEHAVLIVLFNKARYMPFSQNISIEQRSNHLVSLLSDANRKYLTDQLTRAVNGPHLLSVSVNLADYPAEKYTIGIGWMYAVMTGLLDRPSLSNLQDLVLVCLTPVHVKHLRAMDWSGLASCRSLRKVVVNFHQVGVENTQLQDSIDSLLDALPECLLELILITDIGIATEWTRNTLQVVNLDPFFRSQRVPHLTNLESNSLYTAFDAIGNTIMEVTNMVRPVRHLVCLAQDIQPQLFLSLTGLKHLTLFLTSVDLRADQMPGLDTPKLPNLIRLEMKIQDKYEPNVYEPFLRYMFKSDLMELALTFDCMSPWSRTLLHDLSKIATLKHLYLHHLASGLLTCLIVNDVVDPAILPPYSWPDLITMNIIGLYCTIGQAEALLRASPNLEVVRMGCSATMLPAVAVCCQNIREIEFISDHHVLASVREMHPIMNRYQWNEQCFRQLQLVRFTQSFESDLDVMIRNYFGSILPPAILNLFQWRIREGRPLFRRRYG